MSGNTFCNICGKYKLSADLPVSIELWKTCNCEPTPPEGEAVPEQVMCNWRQDGNPPFNCKLPANHSGDHSAVSSPIPAPVVSTAAPEPPQIKVQRYDPIAEIQEIANNLAKSGDCIGSLKLEAAINALAPESYKPAEGPKWNEILLKFREYRLWMHEQVNWLANKWQQRGDVECREEMLDLLRIEPDAATPVTVEAPRLKQFTSEIADKLAKLGFHRDCGNNNRLVIEHELETMEEVIALASVATPKPIGDVEAVNEAIKDAIEELCRHICVRMPKNSVLPIKFSEAETIMRSHLSPFFAPAGPEISSDEIRHLVDCVHIGLNGSVSAHEGFGNSSCIACIVGLKLAANGTSPAQPPCSECATLRKERDEAKLAAKYECVQKAIAIEQSLADSDRAEAAEAQLSTQLQAFKDAQDSLNDALSHLRHSSNENAIIYVKEGLTFISAALAPTPEVAPKE